MHLQFCHMKRRKHAGSVQEPLGCFCEGKVTLICCAHSKVEFMLPVEWHLKLHCICFQGNPPTAPCSSP